MFFASSVDDFLKITSRMRSLLFFGECLSLKQIEKSEFEGKVRQNNLFSGKRVSEAHSCHAVDAEVPYIYVETNAAAYGKFFLYA